MLIAIHALWVVGLLITVFRIMHTVDRWRPSGPSAQAFTVDEVMIPDDLMAMAMQYPEPWAQDDTIKVIRERYEALKDWNRVRAAVGIGSRSDA
jgi:hypothetical protein